MDNNEIEGRILALEALLTEVMVRLPRETSDAAIAAALPGLQRRTNDLARYTTLLAADIRRKLPRPR